MGVLQVLNHEGGPFGEHDIGLLNFLAVGTSYAVENANLTQEVLDRNRELEAATHRAERRRAELDLLYQLEQESAASSDLEATLSSIIARACERLRSKGGAVLLLQDQQATLFHLDLAGAEDRTRPLLHRSLVDPEAGVIGWVARTGEPLISNALDEDPRYNPSASDDPQVKAVLAVPLVWDHRVIGAVRVHTPSSRPGESHGGYDLEDLKVLTLIAGQVARGVSLAQARKEQLDTERLAAIGQMLAGVAHDLRNPMTVISGLAQIMADDLDVSARQRRCERILNQIDEMTAMIGDLLAFARGDRVLHPAIIDLGVFVHDIEETLRAQCGPRGIELVIQAESGTIFVDVSRAKRILYNLTKNAVDALNRGGRLTVSLAVDGGGLRLRVEDTGPGMSSEVRARLFDPFFTAGKLPGTGLGLSIVKRFVDDHHGKIEVESTPGKGTVFTVSLPRPRPETSAVSPSAARRAAEAISPVMARLSAYMSEARNRALPEPVLEKTKHHVLDTIAAMVSGAELPPGRAAIALCARLRREGRGDGGRFQYRLRADRGGARERRAGARRRDRRLARPVALASGLRDGAGRARARRAVRRAGHALPARGRARLRRRHARDDEHGRAVLPDAHPPQHARHRADLQRRGGGRLRGEPRRAADALPARLHRAAVLRASAPGDATRITSRRPSSSAANRRPAA